jgi:hypothetical protein
VVHSNGKRILLPLTSALGGLKKHLLEWFLVMMNDFNAAKTVLRNKVQLVHPDPAAAICLP